MGSVRGAPAFASVRVVAFGFVLLSAGWHAAGCTEPPAAAPTSATKVANGVVLRAHPPAIDLALGGRTAPTAFFADREEVVASLALVGHARVEDESIARLEGDALIAIAAGETKLHLESSAPFSGALDVPVVVHAAPPTSLVIADGRSPGEPAPVISARIGEPVPLAAIATWAEGPKDATYDVEWSADGALAIPSVAESPRWAAVRGEKPGRLRATLGALSAETTVTPLGKPPVAIEIHLAWAFLGVRRFGAYARYEDGEVREVSAACLWTTGDASWRGARDRREVGPLLPVEELSWSKTASCEIAGVVGHGSLFSD